MLAAIDFPKRLGLLTQMYLCIVLITWLQYPIKPVLST